MVEVKNIEVYGINRAVNAINNSFNVGEIDTTVEPDEKRWKVAKALGKNDKPKTCEDSFLKGILVEFDMKGNGVFLPEFQRYAYSMSIVMSQSTMHSMEKFMNEDKNDGYDPFTKYVSQATRDECKKNYLAWVGAKKEFEELQNGFTPQDVDLQKKLYKEAKDKIYTTFETLVHNLPRGFELWSTVTSNYLGLKNIVHQRFGHKNVEDWKALVAACYSMPRFRELCGFTDEKWNLENW